MHVMGLELCVCNTKELLNYFGGKLPLVPKILSYHKQNTNPYLHCKWKIFTSHSFFYRLRTPHVACWTIFIRPMTN